MHRLSFQSPQENFPLVLYANMRMVSSRMVDAARARNWERLRELEKDVNRQRESVLERAPGAPLSPEMQAQRVALIKSIFADDREVRRHTHEWMDKLPQLLGHSAWGRSVAGYAKGMTAPK
jgi:flagellar protein FliT